MTSAGVVLAAGGSSRLGRPKQLLPLGGRFLLQVVLEQVCASALDQVVVVLGAHAEEIGAAFDLGRAEVVLSPSYQLGLSASLRAGVLSLGEEVDRAMIVLGDQPDISAQLLDRLLALHRSSGREAAALSLGGVLHPPVVLSRSLWGELESLQGDVGCRAVIRGRPELVAALQYEGRSGHPVDVDTERDYRRLVAPGN